VNKIELNARLLAKYDAIDEPGDRKKLFRHEVDFISKRMKLLEFGRGHQGSDMMLKYFNSAFDHEIYNISVSSFANENRKKHIKDFVELIDASTKYLNFLENMKMLSTLVKEPKTYQYIPDKHAASEFKASLHKTLEASYAAAVTIFNKKTLASPKNLNQLDALNKSVLALIKHAATPPTQKKTSLLTKVAQSLNQLKDTRPVKSLRAAWKKVIAISIQISNSIDRSLEKGYVNLLGGIPAKDAIKHIEKNRAANVNSFFKKNKNIPGKKLDIEPEERITKRLK
jgi:hypothetical protein